MFRMVNGRIFLPNWVFLLPVVCTGGAERLCRRLGVSYGNVYNLIREFIRCGWLSVEKVGRNNVYTYTAEGLRVVHLCNELIKIVGDDKKLGNR